jgi:hypothetical protein
VAAYYYAYLCDLPKAVNPICLFTGDEGFRADLYADDLREHFGGKHQDTTANKVFADLAKKFKGNVLLIHRFYDGGTDERIVREWREALGEKRVILLPRGSDGDLAVGDVTLGVYAIVSGARTLAQYMDDMRTRPLDLAQNVKYEPQSPERIRQVEKALQPLEDFKPVAATKAPTVNGTKKKSGEDAPRREKSQNEKDKSWKV